VTRSEPSPAQPSPAEPSPAEPSPAEPSPAGSDARSTELAAALAQLRYRIATAARSVGRDDSSVTLVAVTKGFPAGDVARLARLGVGCFGENRTAELAEKAVEVARLLGSARPLWHMVGQLQTNKTADLARTTGVAAVHSVDRERLVRSLDRAWTDRARPASHGPNRLPCFVQVDLDPEPRDRRGGARSDQVAAIAAAIEEAPSLDLVGVMAVAPQDRSPAEAFEVLAQVRERLRADHPMAAAMSAGMSGDFEDAIRAGATHVRVGAALLGARPPLR